MAVKKITIALDGGAGVGKSSTAKGVAKALGYVYVDTGAMYRTMTLFVLEQGIDPNNKEAVESAVQNASISYTIDAVSGNNQIRLNGEHVSDAIRSHAVNEAVAIVSSYPKVRVYLRSLQRELAKDGGVVMDGRDMGSVVVPDAELKVHMIADLDVRAQRRQNQLAEKGEHISLEEIKRNMQERDELDYHGENATSVIASDARELDTSHLTIDQQIQQIVDWARALGA